MKKIKFIIIMITALAVICGSYFLFGYLGSVKEYRQMVNAIDIENIDISKIPDGIYHGECDVNFIHVKVEVNVKGGAITGITLLEHKNERGKPAEGIINAILENQSLDVDAVTGATNSSKVILKAIENALRQQS